MDRRVLRDFRALRGQAGRHRGDPVGDPVARAQRSPRRTGAVADGRQPFHVVVPTPRNREVVPVRSTGASIAIQKLGPVVSALQQAGFVVDCTIEGLMHAAETPDILKAGARILNISNEHPEALERMVPDTALEKRVRAAVKNAARNQTDARDLQGGHRARRRHGRRPDRRRLGLDRPAGHAGALARRHRRQLPQEQDRQRHDRDGARRHQPDLQALSGDADQDDAEGRLRHRPRRRGHRCGDDARPISRPGATARPMRCRMSAGA